MRWNFEISFGTAT